MAGADHHPGISIQRITQVGHPRGWQHAKLQGIPAGTANPCGERRPKHFTRGTRVAPNQNPRPRGALLTQGAHERPTNPYRKLRGEFGIRHTANTISAKILSHTFILPKIWHKRQNADPFNGTTTPPIASLICGENAVIPAFIAIFPSTPKIIHSNPNVGLGAVLGVLYHRHGRTGVVMSRWVGL